MSHGLPKAILVLNGVPPVPVGPLSGWHALFIGEKLGPKSRSDDRVGLSAHALGNDGALCPENKSRPHEGRPAGNRSGHEARVYYAAGPVEAAALVGRARPSLVVIRPEVAWHRRFVESFPVERRPAVLGVGGDGAGAPLIDDWLQDVSDAQEFWVRARLAQERARQRRRSTRRVFSDALTGLPNRRAVVRHLVREAARVRRLGGPLALVLLDLDGFKAINDEQGHQEGDRVLRRVGLVLKRAVRGDELCGRIGGDEFALVLSGELRDGKRAARRMVEALRAAGISASAAAGVLQNEEGLRALYRRTDSLLRETKRRRRLLRIAHVGMPPAPVIVGRGKRNGHLKPLSPGESQGTWTHNKGGRIERYLRDVRQDKLG